MHILKIAAVVTALALAGTAHAQGTAPAPAPAPAPVIGPPAGADFHSLNERGREFGRLSDEVNGRSAGPARSRRPVPVHPDDVTVGSEVRDSKGVVLGTIERVGMDYAVIVSPGGKIEIEFDSLAKNNKGLLINMPKSQFDDIVAGNGKPNK